MAGGMTLMTGMAKGTLGTAKVKDFKHGYSGALGYRWLRDVPLTKFGRYVGRSSRRGVKNKQLLKKCFPS